jgi:hypothetical protein
MKHVPIIISLYVLRNQQELYKIALNVKVPTTFARILHFLRIRNLKRRQWTSLLEMSALNTLI